MTLIITLLQEGTYFLISKMFFCFDVISLVFLKILTGSAHISSTPNIVLHTPIFYNHLLWEENKKIPHYSETTCLGSHHANSNVRIWWLIPEIEEKKPHGRFVSSENFTFRIKWRPYIHKCRTKLPAINMHSIKSELIIQPLRMWWWWWWWFFCFMLVHRIKK